MINLERRTLIAGLSALAGGCAINSHQPGTTATTTTNTGGCDDQWQQAQVIRRQTVVPQFPSREFDITQFGARPGADASAALAEAIQACADSGGGKVLVPVGEFFTGPLHLRSNVNLHLVKGSTLKFYTEPERYLPAVFTRWEGMELMGYSPLVYAFEQTNIAVTGEGTLDGQASMENWWPWKGGNEWGRVGVPTQHAAREALQRDLRSQLPPENRHYSTGSYFRPPFVQFYRCQNILVENIRVVRSPFWLLNPVLCKNVTVRGVHLESLGPNSDGCNPESCDHVVIENCYFDTGDDCIAIKSGRNEDGRRIHAPSQNIVISGCEMRAGHGGVVVGSEISGGARNVFVENCHMNSPDLERGIRIKTNSVRGGLIENIYVRNLVIGKVKDALVINFYYEEGDAGKFDPSVRNIEIENILCQHAERVFQVRGFARANIEGLVIRNAYFQKAAELGIIEHVQGLQLENVNVNGERADLAFV